MTNCYKLWLHEVRIPRSLLGEQISALRDTMHLLRKCESILSFYGSEELAKLHDQNTEERTEGSNDGKEQMDV